MDCGFGNLVFGQTFSDNDRLAKAIMDEREGTRNLGFYIRDPHVLVSLAPQKLFIDPSYTYRLWFDSYERPSVNRTLRVERAATAKDASDACRIYSLRQMIPPGPEFIEGKSSSGELFFFVAKSAKGKVVGSVMGIDHVAAFRDPENGSSLWELAVDTEACSPGVGETLIDHVARFFMERGRSFMDLSVMHDNAPAIRLYEKLGFRKVPVFCVKHKNEINEPLYSSAPASEDGLTIYSKSIIAEARRRGILAEVTDVGKNCFSLSFGGRTLDCRESLTELTSSMGYMRCRDKTLTNAILRRKGMRVPEQATAEDVDECVRLARKHGLATIKPREGEQGRGVISGVGPDDVRRTLKRICREPGNTLVEEHVEGKDLRVLVINHEYVAAVVRKPPKIIGDGKLTVRKLISKLSRRRAAATSGESFIPMDDETRRCVRGAGYGMDDVLPKDVRIDVRKNANVHTGGINLDVTSKVSADIRRAAEDVTRMLDVPVAGVDMLTKSVRGSGYTVIEVNERPDLAIHEPQKAVSRFVDFLFPQTAGGAQ